MRNILALIVGENCNYKSVTIKELFILQRLNDSLHIYNSIMFYKQPTEISQTGVPGARAARLVGLVLKCDLETAPIPHRSTMAKIARDLGTRHRRVTQDLVQVNYK